MWAIRVDQGATSAAWPLSLSGVGSFAIGFGPEFGRLRAPAPRPPVAAETARDDGPAYEVSRTMSAHGSRRPEATQPAYNSRATASSVRPLRRAGFRFRR